MLVSSVLSLVASFVLSVDALRLAEDPNAALGCNINSVISCGTVAAAWQSQVLGFPNAFLGLITEPVVITIAVAGLAGVRFPRWFMLTAQVFYTIGLLFAYWLFHQAMFEIGALCPWCMLVTLGDHPGVLRDDAHQHPRQQPVPAGDDCTRSSTPSSAPTST